jgi:hypothetical protein
VSLGQGDIADPDLVTEPNEWLRIETGWPGDAQAGDFGNATLQPVENVDGEFELEFSVATHVGVPARIATEEQLRDFLLATFQQIVDLDLCIAFDIKLGPAGDGEGE